MRGEPEDTADTRVAAAVVAAAAGKIASPAVVALSRAEAQSKVRAPREKEMTKMTGGGWENMKSGGDQGCRLRFPRPQKIGKGRKIESGMAGGSTAGGMVMVTGLEGQEVAASGVVVAGMEILALVITGAQTVMDGKEKYKAGGITHFNQG